jgi:hypothetical protein
MAKTKTVKDVKKSKVVRVASSVRVVSSGSNEISKDIENNSKGPTRLQSDISIADVSVPLGKRRRLARRDSDDRIDRIIHEKLAPTFDISMIEGSPIRHVFLFMSN